MKIILAFDSFKECLTAAEACRAARLGVLDIYPHAEVVSLPLSDGGEGLTECLASVQEYQWRTIQAHDALMRPITASYLISADGHTAVMEMAATCGLGLIPTAERDVMRATTFGVGQMLLDAARQGVRHIVIGIGGSATCDAGRGMAEVLTPHLHEFRGVDITVACDVTNPLYGPHGAAYTFAPQKGATPGQVRILDERLRAFALEYQARGASPALAAHPGAGAAGGLGYALMALIGARLTSGIDTVLQALNFDTHLLGASLVVTGEGRSDSQTLRGKVPFGVLQRATAQGVPVALLSGAIEAPSALTAAGFRWVRAISAPDDPRPLAELLRPDVAKANLRTALHSLLSAGS